MTNFMGQKGQDRWVVEEVFDHMEGGYFVELGASQGYHNSNTYVLEKDYNWDGLCIEANPVFFEKLQKNRSCTCLHTCIDSSRHDVEYMLDGGYSGIIDDDTDNNEKARKDRIEEYREKGAVIRCGTITLEEALEKAGAPNEIDYLSLDVEGAETRILSVFPFERYRFLAMTIERPTPELNELLFSKGYRFVKNDRFDTYYVHESLDRKLNLPKEPFSQVPVKDW